MLVAALSLSKIDLSTIEGYISDIKKILAAPKPAVAVLPAHSALALGLGIGKLNSRNSYQETFASYIADGAEWIREFLDLHGHLSKELQVYLAAGTVIEKEENRLYHTVYCFNPVGQVCGVQRQTHLTRFERDLNLSRGERLDLFTIGDLHTGLVVGNDARHPEVGRIMALQGADLLLYSGAIAGDQTCWQQAAGMWAQVQQNQFFAVEAQLSTTIGGLNFGAGPAIVAPCEITFGNTGYLALGNPVTPLVYADLDEKALAKIRNDYPLLKLLNPDAYSELYRGEPK